MKYKNIDQTREQTRSGVMEPKPSTAKSEDRNVHVHDQKTSEHSSVSSTGSSSSVKDLTASVDLALRDYSVEVSHLKQKVSLNV